MDRTYILGCAWTAGNAPRYADDRWMRNGVGCTAITAQVTQKAGQFFIVVFAMSGICLAAPSHKVISPSNTNSGQRAIFWRQELRKTAAVDRV